MSRTYATLPDRLRLKRGVPSRYFWGWKLHQGRQWKRWLSKARRRAWKAELRTGVPEDGQRVRYERECNWKTW